MPASATVLAQLRATIGAPRLLPGRLPCGVAAMDAWLGGWPQPGVIEIAGGVGTGRLALILPTFARLGAQGRSVVVVDPLVQFHPPGAGPLRLDRVVIVRPPPEQAAWAAEQVARSGAVEAMVLLDAPPLRRAGVRLARACEVGGMAVFVVGGAMEEEIPAALRLHTQGWAGDAVRVRCIKSRDGRMEGTRTVALGGAA
jgi:hypothetical protein